MPHPDFVGLVNSLLATAEAALGDQNAMTARARQDGLMADSAHARRAAERSLNLLLMLAEKTRGNLDLTEAELLSSAVADLRARLADA